MPAPAITHLPESTSSDARVGAFLVLGFRFQVRTRLSRVARLVEELLAPFRAEPDDRAATYEIVDDHQPWSQFSVRFEGQSIREYDSLEPVLDYLFWHINREAINSVTDRLVVHASACSRGEEGVLMPAPMGSGKSTLVAGLTAAGLSYLTDEGACLDLSTGLLYPYTKPIWLGRASVEALPGLPEALASKWGRELGDRYQVLAQELSAAPTGDRCRVGYVILPHYEEGSQTLLEPISKAQAVKSLAQSCFNFNSFGKAGLNLLGDVVSRARCYRLRMGDLASAVRVVLDTVDGPEAVQLCDGSKPRRHPAATPPLEPSSQMRAQHEIAHEVRSGSLAT